MKGKYEVALWLTKCCCCFFLAKCFLLFFNNTEALMISNLAIFCPEWVKDDERDKRADTAAG